jgi:hypothetical protein
MTLFKGKADAGNAIPQLTNILPIANTSSSDPYQNNYREKGL